MKTFKIYQSPWEKPMKDSTVSKDAVLKLAMSVQTELHIQFFIFAKVLINLTNLLCGCFHNLYSPQISLHPVKKNMLKVATKILRKGFNLAQS